MKKLFFIAVVLMSTMMLNAQDVIVTNNAQKIDAKIVEVSKTEIKYKEADNLDGPIFVLPTSDISSIIYSNGKVTLYNTSQKEELPMQRHNSATILLVNGDSILGEIADMNSGSITYSQNGRRFTLPASQVRTVTLANGQVRQYTQVSVSSTPTQKSTTETSSSRHEVVMFERSDDTGVYYLGDKSMTEKQYLEFIYHNCDVAWDVYRKGKKMEKAGYILMLVGAPLTGIGLGCIIAGEIGLASDIINGRHYNSSSYGAVVAGSVFVSVGTPLLAVGIPLYAVGHNKKSNSYEEYNKQCAKPEMTLNLQTFTNGVGLALNF